MANGEGFQQVNKFRQQRKLRTSELWDLFVMVQEVIAIFMYMYALLNFKHPPGRIGVVLDA